MKRLRLNKNSHATVSVIGMVTALILLSGAVWAENVTAEYQDGVLKITLPKIQTDQAPQKITVK